MHFLHTLSCNIPPFAASGMSLSLEIRFPDKGDKGNLDLYQPDFYICQIQIDKLHEINHTMFVIAGLVLCLGVKLFFFFCD